MAGAAALPVFEQFHPTGAAIGRWYTARILVETADVTFAGSGDDGEVLAGVPNTFGLALVTASSQVLERAASLSPKSEAGCQPIEL